MKVLCVAVTYCLAVAGLYPHLSALQKAHYKPLGKVERKALWVWVATCAYALALYGVWVCLSAEDKWCGLYLAAAYLPQSVWLAIRVTHVRVRVTARLIRLWAVGAAVLAVPMGLAIAYRGALDLWAVWAVAGYPVAQAAGWITYPIEEGRNRRFCKREGRELMRRGVCVVGITGSAGKTTVKRLITAALGTGAYATKGNYNTPIGIALSVCEMPPDTKWFVAEMGVGKPNDMRDLLDMVHPQVGVVTCVLPQHTAHFERVEDIRQEKCRLLDCAEWGLCHTSVGYPAHSTYGEGGDVWAEDVTIAKDGVKMTICDKRERHCVRLPLVGRQTVDNALCAWAVARHLGVAPEVIAARWRRVQGEPHRLEVSKSDRGVWIVDDSYNCNIRGAEYALEYIGLYEGRKVVAVSGIDEADEALGLNVRLGEMIGRAADVAVVVGERYQEALCEGMGDKIPVYRVPSTEKSVELYRQLLQEGDVLLILADYPT